MLYRAHASPEPAARPPAYGAVDSASRLAPAGAASIHDLRHTHASLLIAADVPIKVVSERLGRAHPAFTMHTYQHRLPGMSAAAADQFAALITAASR